MKALLVYPKYPDTFWSFKHALWFIGKKAAHQPLGLITVAAMFPKHWIKKLIDMNVEELKDEDIKWADMVFISAMSVQKDSVREIIERCKGIGKKIVAGGPLFTSTPEEFGDVDHLVLNEAEVTFPVFLQDLENGEVRKIYETKERPDLVQTPIPQFELLNMGKYGSMSIQYSRGCPNDCDFCDITVLYGHVPRTKTPDQIISELENLYLLGWRGGVFFSDDNFIGNSRKLKTELLPALKIWVEDRNHPFSFFTQCSISLADDPEMMKMMVEAGFDSVFVGIESPNPASLRECNKFLNENRDLVESVKKIQRAGLQVQGGFIIGFDNDPDEIFEMQIKFIQESGIVAAMVGLLNALPMTKLFQRLKEEKRLLSSTTGNNTDYTINFIPKMEVEKLRQGYQSVVSYIYTPKNYYARVKKFLQVFNPGQPKIFHFRPDRFKAWFKSMFWLGIVGKERFQYWKLCLWTLVRRPRLFPLAVTLAIYGYHFRKVFESNFTRIK